MKTVYLGEFERSNNNFRSQTTAEFLKFVALVRIVKNKATGSCRGTYFLLLLSHKLKKFSHEYSDMPQ